MEFSIQITFLVKLNCIYGTGLAFLLLFEDIKIDTGIRTFIFIKYLLTESKSVN